MNKHWPWAIGGAIFIAIVGVWAWQLPQIIAFANGGRHDDGLSAIVNNIGMAGGSIKGDMVGVQERLDANLKNIDRALKIETSRAAAIDDLKKKIDDNAAKDIQTATVPAANSLPNTP